MANSDPNTNSAINYVTQGFDNGRTGWNSKETVLSVNSLKGGFANLATLAVEGEVFAQPLCLSGVVTKDGKPHDVLLVVTSANWIYAFDADTYAVLWSRSVTPPNAYPYASDWAYWGLSYNDLGRVLKSYVGQKEAYGVAPVGGNPVGIIGTPVLDEEKKVVYFVSTYQTVPFNAQNGPAPGTVWHALHRIDLTTGEEMDRSPQRIEASEQGISFDSRVQLQRPGLLLLDGRLYLGFGSYGDNTNVAQYYGWVLIYEASTLKQVAAFLPCPDAVSDPTSGKGGSIWQCGIGIAADDSGRTYFATGNGEFKPPQSGVEPSDFGNSVVQLTAGWTSGPPRSYFTPANESVLDAHDLDQGSGGVVIIPGSFGGKQLAVQVGKYGVVFVLNQNDLGGYQQGPGNTDNVVDSSVKIGATALGSYLYGAPVYGKLSSGEAVLFFCGINLVMERYMFEPDGKLSTSPMKGSDTFPGYGAIPAVSSNGSAAGTTIVWAIRNAMDGTNKNMVTDAPNNLSLRAYNAENIGEGLVNLPCGTWFKRGSFLVPTVANGKVFVGSDGQVAVFGLR